MMNPLLVPLNELIDYQAVTPESIHEAITVLLAEHKASIEQAIERNQTHISWDSFIDEVSDARLWRAWNVASHLSAVLNTQALRQVINELLPQITEHSTWLGLNQDLYQAYLRLAQTPLTPIQERIVELSIRDFELDGVQLQGEQRTEFSNLSSELAITTQRFSENCLDATDSWFYLCTDKTELAGLPDDVIQAAAQEAGQPNTWKLTLKAPCLVPVLKYAHHRDLRQRLYRAYTTLASEQSEQPQFNNASYIETILRLRTQQAKLLGFTHYADLQLQTRMATSAQEVIDFLRYLAQQAKPYAEQDMAAIQSYAREHMQLDSLEPWDYSYVSEQLRQSRYDYSEDTVTQYLPQAQVMQGLQNLCQRLFNIQLVRTEVPTWHPDVQVYLIQENQQTLGYLYMDLYARKGKQSGAWVNAERPRMYDHQQLVLPIATLTCNFSPAQGDKPALLTLNDVTTLFHEMGHALHCLLCEIDHPAANAFNAVEWDAIELPSQFMENFCWDKNTLQSMSAHWQTGKPLPDELYERILAAKNFQSGMQTVRQIEFALFDILLHQQSEPQSIESVLQLLHTVRQEVAVVIPPEWNRFPHSFSHIFAGGYAAGYYSYKWAEVLSADAYSAFEESTNLTQTGQHFRYTILASGGARPAATTFVAFRGREPSAEALLRLNGLTQS